MKKTLFIALLSMAILSVSPAFASPHGGPGNPGGHDRHHNPPPHHQAYMHHPGHHHSGVTVYAGTDYFYNSYPVYNSCYPRVITPCNYPCYPNYGVGFSFNF